MDHICDANTRIRTADFIDCLHGVGHGFYLKEFSEFVGLPLARDIVPYPFFANTSDYVLNQALDMCDGGPTNDARYACASGVYMSFYEFEEGYRDCAKYRLVLGFSLIRHLVVLLLRDVAHYDPYS